MQPATREDLQRFAPHALPEYIDALVAGWDAITAAGIDTPLRWCHFIAQCAHETGGLRIVRENTRWTGAQMKALWPGRFPLGAADPRIIAARGDDEALANLAYSNRRDIGNQGGSDGWDFRGGSFLQLTGRAAYGECADAIAEPLEAFPEMIEQPAVGLRAALWAWGRHPNSEFAGHNYGRTIGNAINRGNPWSSLDPIGYPARRQWLDRAWAIWGQGEQPVEATLHLGAWGPQVASVQRRLKELGYPIGAADGVLGPATARALAGFKLDQERLGRPTEPAESVGPLTLAALQNAASAPLSPERTGATVASLVAAGSTEVATGQKAKATGQSLLYTGAAAGADSLGIVDALKDGLGWLPAAQATIVPVIAAMQWGIRNLLPVAVLLLGVWLWIKGKDVIMARLRAHQTGSNLSR